MIGSANNVFKADSNGIYLGNATFASAPFSVDMAGNLYSSGGIFVGLGLADDYLSFMSNGTHHATLHMGTAGNPQWSIDGGAYIGMWMVSDGYVASALGTKSATIGALTGSGTSVYSRTVTINGVTVHLVTTD